MRLRKTMNIVTEEREIVDYDPLGNPIYEVVKTHHPIKCNIEPFSSSLAEKSYGVFVEATNRVFSKPNSLIKLQSTVSHSDKLYKVTEIIQYDKHYETLLQETGDIDE